MLDRRRLLAENARLKAEIAQLKKRNETLDLQRLLLLEQVIDLKAAADAAGLEFNFGE